MSGNLGDMVFPRRRLIATALFAAALLAHPCGVLAQRGGAGRSIGGSNETVSGLSNLGRPSGVAQKDDLKDFHEALAVQASSEQVAEFAAMQRSVASARAVLQALAQQLHKDATASTTAFDQALESARTENKKFLNGLSDRQKSGLKEMIKQVTKADSDLAQPAQELAQAIRDANLAKSSEAVASSAQRLDRGLEKLQNEQLGLGEEMGIGDASHGGAAVYDLAPVKRSVELAGQSFVIVTSGVISPGPASDSGTASPNTFKLELTLDMTDLQHNMTDVLRAKLDKSDRCGERIAVQNATLAPLVPASQAVVQLHYERWACFGREAANEIVEGNGSIEVKLTPVVADDGTLRLRPEISRVQAQGLVGELLRSGSLGDGLREKIAEELLSAVSQGGDVKALLPAAAVQASSKLQRAEFQGIGAGRLLVVLEEEMRASDADAALLMEELKANELKAEESKATELKIDQLKTRASAPESAPEANPH
jgi:hypothetical protein